MSGFAAAGEDASSIGEDVAAGREDNCGSGPLFWAAALDMGAAAAEGCVSGTLCVVLLELPDGDSWGAGVALCVGAGCEDGNVCAGCVGKGAVAWTDRCAEAERVGATGGSGVALGALGADGAVVAAANADEAVVPADGKGADAAGAEVPRTADAGAVGVRADVPDRSDSADVEAADPAEAGGAGSATDTVVFAAPAVSCFPKSIHTPLAAAGGAACLCAGLGTAVVAATAVPSGVIVKMISFPVVASSYFPARCRSTTSRVTGGLGSFSP